MTDESPQAQLDLINRAFEQDIERFVRFGDWAEVTKLDLETAITEQRAVADVRTQYLGKKSALAATKKLIGRLAPEARAAFGQLVQATEDQFQMRLDQIGTALTRYIEEARTARESIDVTMPGRRPR